jgi:hypothetical protein
MRMPLRGAVARVSCWQSIGLGRRLPRRARSATCSARDDRPVRLIPPIIERNRQKIQLYWPLRDIHAIRKVTWPTSLCRLRPMRMLLRGAVALVILIVAYWAWALVGAAQLASAAERGDADAVIERVDLQALIRSLSGQIARAFLDQNPQLQKAPPPRPGAFLNASAAEMLLRALLTPDNIAALLSQGRVSVVGAGGKDSGTVWGMPSLGEAFNARPLQVIMHSYFDGPRSFVVGLDSSDGRYRIHMNLSGLTWRMSGVDIPEPITARLAHLIAQRIGGAVDLRGD